MDNRNDLTPRERDDAEPARDDASALVANHVTTTDESGLIRPPRAVDDRQLTSDGSGDAVPGLSNATSAP